MQVRQNVCEEFPSHRHRSAATIAQFCYLEVLRMTTADLIQTMTDRIVQDFNPLRIILFGSHARGDAGPESDIDLLVVFPQVANKRLAAVAIRRTPADLPVCKDVVVTTPEEIARRGDLIGTVLRPALREGKVLYERS